MAILFCTQASSRNGTLPLHLTEQIQQRYCVCTTLYEASATAKKTRLAFLDQPRWNRTRRGRANQKPFFAPVILSLSRSCFCNLPLFTAFQRQTKPHKSCIFPLKGKQSDIFSALRNSPLKRNSGENSR